MGGSSKRKLKQHTKQSLSFKGTQPRLQDNAPQTLLSGDLVDDTMTEQVLLSKKRRAVHTEQAAATAQPLSKSEQRKLQQLERKRQSHERLAGAYASLQTAQLNDRALAVLGATSSRGGAFTQRQQLKQHKVLADAGVALPADSRLLKKRNRHGQHIGAAPASLQRVYRHDAVAPAAQIAPCGSQADATAAMHHAAIPDAAKADVHGDNDASGPHASRDLSAAKPPMAVTFAKKGQAQGSGGPEPQLHGEDNGCKPSLPHPASTPEARQQALSVKQKLRRDGELPDQEAGDAVAKRSRATQPLGPVRHRRIERTPTVEEARGALPILSMEQEIMEAVDQNDVFLLCGETGCGKTTQVPQFLLEAGFGCAQFPERAGAVAVTQPRRVAAVSTARRVAAELGGQVGGLVGHQVRFDRRAGAGTGVVFMTDGILMREAQADPLLRKFSVVVLDEAHERSLNTDLLTGLLSRIVPQRRALAARATPAGDSAVSSGDPAPTCAVQPLKIVIMSATLRVADFAENTRLFPRSLYPQGPPPVLHVPARQYPVTVHFSKRTEQQDYIGAAFRKTARVHRELPPGGILVFVTGQREVQQLCEKLRDAFAAAPADGPCSASSHAAAVQDAGDGADVEAEAALDGADWAEAAAHTAHAPTTPAGPRGDRREDAGGSDSEGGGSESADEDAEEEPVQLGCGTSMSSEELQAAERYFEERFGLQRSSQGTRAVQPTSGAAAEDTRPADNSGTGSTGKATATQSRHAPVHVLPLYAMLAPAKQAQVFEPPPEGHRLIVVATNVAETSLTIPGIRYVVDAGRAKSKLLDAQAATHRFDVRWISQAAADQRAGRAGRTGPGHCYRLYSSAVLKDLFPEHTPPEIANTSLDGVVLSMWAMGLPKVVNFPFPSAPPVASLRTAEASLVHLSALRPSEAAAPVTLSAGDAAAAQHNHQALQLTPLGRATAAFPVAPRAARIILEAAELVATGRCKDSALVAHAVALAAAASTESPFMHSDTPHRSADDGAFTQQVRISGFVAREAFVSVGASS